MIDIYALTDQEILKEMGARIQRYRLDSNLTQRMLANEAGVSLSTLSKIEKGGSVAFHSIVAVLRAENRLEMLETLVKEPEISPIAYAKMLDGQKVRRRASSAGSDRNKEDTSW